MLGIKKKASRVGVVANRNTRRYFFYPLAPINFASSQATSPLWNHQFPRARLVSQEPVEYKAKGDPDDTPEHPMDGATLEVKVQGTDAQRDYLIIYEPQGMTYLEMFDDLDTDTAIEIDRMMYPDGTVPQNLPDLKAHLEMFLDPNFKSKDPELLEIAKPAIEEMIEGVDRAIQWTINHTASLDKEIQDARAGKMGRPNLVGSDHYYYNQIKKALPDDRVGANMGNSLAEALKQIMQVQGGSKQEEHELNELRAEVERIKAESDALKEQNKIQEEVIEQYESSKS